MNMNELNSIIYADNDEVSREMTKVLFTSFTTINPVIAETIDDILESIDEKQPDLIILNDSVFNTNEIDQFRNFSCDTRVKNIPIILIAEKTESENVLPIEDHELFETIQKPCSLTDIIKKFKEICSSMTFAA